MTIASVIVLLAALGIMIFLNHPQFGRNPSGERLELIKKSFNYNGREFRNLSNTPVLTEGISYYTVFKEFFFDNHTRRKPDTPVPSQKTDLYGLNIETEVLVWFGHSSYYMQTGGKRILVDPVLCGSASPIKFTTRSFKGSDIYTPEDIPEIDYLFITHDHWDHLDYETLSRLRSKIKKIVTGLGVGEHFERWGFDSQQIIECDWYDTVSLDAGFKVIVTPARHFSGRLFKRNQTLWVSFVLDTPGMRIFMGGDGGYDNHFAKIGEDYGPFDLAILECGQYNKNWKNIHSMPGEVFTEAHELRAARILPVHWSKFQLASHEWDEPIKMLTRLSKTDSVKLVTPLIGERVDLK